TAGWWSRCQS
ncbi:phage minor tail protein L, partial [Escherichia coli FDA506]